LAARQRARDGSIIGEVLAKTQIGVEEYLGLVFPDRPEPDYVHGEVVERALPTLVHAQIQALLVLLFGRLLPKIHLTLLTEPRLQIEPDLFRVVDFAVCRGARPEGRYATSAVYIAIEIVSPDDRYNDLTERLEDCRRWGVAHVWLVDPQRKRLWEYTEAGLLQHAGLRLPEFDFEISSQELFKDI
jgi:Uma2 family endonuclease